MTEADNLTVQDFAVKKQRDCDSSSSEEELDEVSESGSGVKMDRGGEGCTEEDVEIDEGPLGTGVNLEDEEEERDTEEEEMRDRLCKLVAQARLSYFASTDDELDKVGVTGGDQECGKDAMEELEAEEDDDEEEKVKKRKQSHEQIGDLPFRICQLEREVRASQFSSTEDELDRAGADDDEARTEDGDGVREELAVKVCRLASQVNATQFSSTEDELDRAGRGEEEEEEEVMDKATLWKLQAEKVVQAAQLRDLSCLVSPSQFSSSEGLEMDEETECQNDVGLDGSIWERTESLEDLDVGMFDLRAENEESSKESGDENVRTIVVHSQKKPVMLEEEKEEMKDKEGQSLVEAVCKDTKRVKEIENDSVMSGTVVHRDKEPDREEAEATQEDVCDGKENRDSTAGDSDDEDEEFNKIISSMLMMTLEDMQGCVFDVDNTEDAGKQDREAMDEEVRAELRLEGQITNISEEAGSLEQLICRSQSVRSEFAAGERSVKDEGERDSGDLKRKRHSDVNRSKEEERHLAGEAALLTEGEEMPGGGRDGDFQEDRGPGKAPADGEDDICRGEDEEHRPGKDEEESGTSQREGPLSPQEIQIVRPSQLTLALWSVQQLSPRSGEIRLMSSMSLFY